MAPQPRPSTSSSAFLVSLRKPFLLAPILLPLLLLLSLRPVACTGGGDTADADSTHETLPEGHSSPPAAPPPPPHRTPSSPNPPSLSSSGVGSVSGGDRNHSPRAAADGNGLIKGLDDDDWGGPWGQRRRRGQGAGGGDDDGLVSMPPRQSCKDLRSKRIISDGFCTSTRPLTEAVCAEKCCGPTPSPNRQRPRGGGGGYRPHKYRPHQPSSPISLHRSSSLRPPWYADYVKVWARGQNEMNSVTASVSGMADDGEEDGEDGGDAGVDEGGDEGTGNGTVEWRCVEDAVRRRRVRLLCRDGTRRTYHVRLVKSCKCVQRRRRKRRRGRRKGRRRLGRLGGLAGRRFIRE